jgi:hypothetical protein
MPVKFNVRTKIKINGKEYNNPEEMPAEVRALYEKALASRGSTAPNVHFDAHSKFTYNGQTFTSPGEMPEDVRRIYDSVMASVDKNGESIPEPSEPGRDGTTEPSAPLLSTLSKAAAPSRVNSRLTVLAFVVILLMLAILAVLLTLPK